MNTEPKHTPGPWQIAKPNKVLGTVLVGCALDNSEGRFSIAEVCSGSPSELATTIADAQLIAASPDLLNALEHLLDTMSANTRIYYNNALHAAVGQAKQAIAKARGETN